MSVVRPGVTRVVLLMEAYSIGGSERFIADLVGGLDPDRFECVLAGRTPPGFDQWLQARVGRAVPRFSAPLTSFAESAPVRIRQRFAERHTGRVSSERPDPAEPSPARMKHVKAALRFGLVPRNYWAVRGLLARVKPDVLHVNNGSYPGAEACRIAPLAARAVGVPRVISFVHGYAQPPAWPVPVERRLDRCIDQRVDEWVTASRGSSRRLEAARALSPGRVKTVHLGQALSPVAMARTRGALRREAGIPHDATVICVIGSLERQKGQADAIRAVAALRRQDIPVHLMLLGEGPDRRSLETQAADADIGRHVSFLGFRQDVEDLLACADLLVSASTDSELLPYAIKEAMAAAIPVVATDVGAVSELVVHGCTGVLVPRGDADALTRGILTVLTSPDGGRALGEAGRDRLERHFTLDAMLQRMSALYDGTAGPL